MSAFKSIKLSKNTIINTSIKNLYMHYWLDNSEPSRSISSFWEISGKKSFVRFADDQKEIKFIGHGFGQFEHKSKSIINPWLPVNIYLKKLCSILPEKLLSAMNEVCNVQNRKIDFDCVKQVLAVNKIIKYGINLDNKNICIIGDGFGFLGCLLKTIFPKVRILSVNLGKISIFDVIFTSICFEKSNLNIFFESKKYKPNYDFNFIPAEDIFTLNIKDIDFFFNIASMQEMNLETVRDYFSFMRKQVTVEKYFYCCNRELKILPDGQIVKFVDYGWEESDDIIFDELCPWYQKYPTNIPPNFLRNFDGVIRHKLIKF